MIYRFEGGSMHGETIDAGDIQGRAQIPDVLCVKSNVTGAGQFIYTRTEEYHFSTMTEEDALFELSQ